MASAIKDSTPALLSPVATDPPSGIPMKSPNHHRNPSLGTSLPTHRVTRRKSMSSTAGTNIAAVAQAVRQAAAESPFSLAAVQGGNNVAAKLNAKNSEGSTVNGYPSPPSSLPTQGPLGASGLGNPRSPSHPQMPGKNSALLNNCAIEDGHAPDITRPTPRNRRASEGAATTLGSGGKGSRMRSGSELKCDKCGKGYKHSSCLTKHLWEHTPEWSYTSKLLISKHQQVQLLEAASILVSMNPTPPASSSGASNNEGSSSANDSSSADETTPPPGHPLTSSVPTPRGIRNGAGKPGKRFSSGSYSRSCQSNTSGFPVAGSAPSALAFPNHLPPRPAPRPRAGSSVSVVRGSVGASPLLRPAATSEDDALAAAVELLSCSFHTPVITPTVPVGSIPRGGLSELGSPPMSGRSFMAPVVEMKREDEDDDMDDLESNAPDYEEGWRRRGRSEEEEDGVFGRMEE